MIELSPETRNLLNCLDPFQKQALLAILRDTIEENAILINLRKQSELAVLPRTFLADLLTNLGVDHLKMYKNTGSRSELVRVKGLWRAALLGTGLAPAQQKEGLRTFGNRLLVLYQQTRRITDFREAAHWLVSTLLDAGLSASDQAESLYDFGNRLRGTYEKTRDIEVLNEAVKCHRMALERAELDLPNLPDLNDTLAVDLLLRYKIMGDDKDLNEWIAASEQAVNTSITRPWISQAYVADYKHNLGLGYLSRFEQLKEADDLDLAVENLNGALKIAPAAWPSRRHVLDQFGRSLYMRYKQSQDVSDLDKAIGLRRDLVADSNLTKTERLEQDILLAEELRARYHMLRRAENLNEAIEIVQRALSLSEHLDVERAALLVDLLYRRYTLTNTQNDLDDALALTKKALGVISAADPDCREAVIANLMAGLHVDSGPKLRDDRIFCAKKALSLLPIVSPARAEISEQLGFDLLMRSFTPTKISSQQIDLDSAIVALRDAIKEINQSPEVRTRALKNLGTALIARFDTSESQEDFSEAVDAWCQALASSASGDISLILRLIKAAPGELSEMQRTVLPALATLVSKLDTLLEAAILRSDDRKTAEIRLTLAGLLVESQVRIASHEDPIEDAIDLVEAVPATVFNDLPEYLPGAAEDILCRAYILRTKGSRRENGEKSIQNGKLALERIPRNASPEALAGIQTNLAQAYFQRIGGEQAENVELAIRYCSSALELRNRRQFPMHWAMLQNLLGLCFLQRERDDSAGNVEKAIYHFNNALEVRVLTQFPEKWADTQNNLASAYLRRSLGDQSDNIEKAIAHSNNALDIRKRESFPNDWAIAKLTLGRAYLRRKQGTNAENASEAAACFASIADTIQREANPELWGAAHHHAGEAVWMLSRDSSDAIAHYQRALEVRALIAIPREHLETQRRLGELYVACGRWSSAHEALEAAIDASDLLYEQAFTEVGRRAEVAQAQNLHAIDAWCLLHLGEPTLALERFDAGRTRLLSDALALDELDIRLLSDEFRDALRGLRRKIRMLEAEMRLPINTPARGDERTLAQELERARAELNTLISNIRNAHPDFMPEGLVASEILGLIPEDAALVTPVVTPQGSAVLVVPSGMSSVDEDQVLWLDTFKKDNLRVLLLGPPDQTQISGWLGAYAKAGTDRKTWHDIIEGTGQVLWDHLMGSIAERLANLAVRHVLLMPQGGLSLLPLHAAWREVEGERRYFLDDYTITYVPSAYARRISIDRLKDSQRHAQTLLAVVDPTKDLPFTGPEGEQLAKLFGEAHVEVLPGDKATVQSVIKARGGYVHFACHGFYRWDDPMQSGLVLANREPMTLAQIIGQLDLDTTRLVVLSACETGITDISQAPDEYLGLPAGFLQAGTPGVVSTLWAVADISTMLLMSQFFFYHMEGGFQPAHALRLAQLWVRDLSAQELAEDFAERRHQGGTHQKQISAAWRRFASIDPGEKPFAHPYFWAPFTFTGA